MDRRTKALLENMNHDYHGALKVLRDGRVGNVDLELVALVGGRGSCKSMAAMLLAADAVERTAKPSILRRIFHDVRPIDVIVVAASSMSQHDLSCYFGRANSILGVGEYYVMEHYVGDVTSFMRMGTGQIVRIVTIDWFEMRMNKVLNGIDQDHDVLIVVDSVECMSEDKLIDIQNSVASHDFRTTYIVTMEVGKSDEDWWNRWYLHSIESIGHVTFRGTYLGVKNRDFLGEAFYSCAESLKRLKPNEYEHLYLGKTYGEIEFDKQQQRKVKKNDSDERG